MLLRQGKKFYYVLFSLAIIVIGLILRLHNISDYLFYPDSYQNLLVAHNLQSYQSVVGRLGAEGMWYPDFFGWTRPFYAILINVFQVFGLSPLDSAKFIAALAGFLTIPMSYLLAWRYCKKIWPALASAFLVAVSYSLTVWGGFVLTETVSILMIMLLLERFFYALLKDTDAYHHSYIIAGLLFGLAILTRYEYVLLVLPMAGLLMSKNKDWRAKLVSLVAPALMIVVLTFLIFPLPFSFASIWEQVRELALVLLLGAAALAVLYALLRAGIHKKLAKIIGNPKVLSLLGLVGAFVLVLLFGGIRRFVANDFLLVATAAAGFSVMLTKAKHRAVGLFLLGSVMLLVAMYYSVNPEMERYLTHILPFLVIPAAFGIQAAYEYVQANRKWRYVAAACVLVAVLGQVFLSYRGLHHRSGGIWFRAGYEQVSAQTLNRYITDDQLLIASLPEPYYFFTGVSTHSVADDYPYVYIDTSLDDREVVIVDDYAMRQYFPKFSEFVEANLQEYAQYKVDAPYRYRNFIVYDTEPVKLYKITLGELRSRLE